MSTPEPNSIWETFSKQSDPDVKLTPRQWEVLEMISESCLDPAKECTGACDHGWYEPLEGWTLTIARRLDTFGLIDLANGSGRRWIAGHVTAFGHAALRVREARKKKVS